MDAAELAGGIVACAAAFVGWHVTAWCRAIQRWQRAKGSQQARTVPRPKPFMWGVGETLADCAEGLAEVARAGLPVLCGFAGLIAVFAVVGAPLGRAHGLLAGLAGATVTYFAAALPFIAMLNAMRRRAEARRALGRPEGASPRGP